jgi:effector-binding domain-containing protein
LHSNCSDEVNDAKGASHTMSSITIPELVEFSSKPTAGIRRWVTFEEFVGVIPQMAGEVVEWVAKQGSEVEGPLYIRYCDIAMPVKMEVEVGFFVKPGLPTGDESVTVGEMPAGRYLSTRYIGPYDGLMDATACVVGFAKEKGIRWDSWETADGEGFASRFELYLTDPDEDPDPQTWITDIAIKVAE